jgi:hypothetical protein
MNLSPVSCNNVYSFKANQTEAPQKKSFAQKIEANNQKVLTYPPAVIGVMNAVCWAAVGATFDKLCSKLFKTNTNPKTSLAVNSIIGLGMGTYAYLQANKLQKACKADSAQAK